MRYVLAATILLTAAAGCASSSKTEQAPVAANTPLPVDPTQKNEIAQWWGNGTQLLQLAEEVLKNE